MFEGEKLLDIGMSGFNHAFEAITNEWREGCTERGDHFNSIAMTCFFHHAGIQSIQTGTTHQSDGGARSASGWWCFEKPVQHYFAERSMRQLVVVRSARSVQFRLEEVISLWGVFREWCADFDGLR